MEKGLLLFDKHSSCCICQGSEDSCLIEACIMIKWLAAQHLYGIERMLSIYFGKGDRVGREHCSMVEAYPDTNANQVASTHTESMCLLYLQ